MIKLTTNFGEMILDLYAQKAPKTVANFEQYVKNNHYNGTIFHRIINDFMIQGGGLTAQMEQKPTAGPIENEANNGISNTAYTVAMARSADPHSATAQFFINVVNNPFLDFTSESSQGWGYAVFGQVIRGQEVVDRMKSVLTSSQGTHQDVPVDPIIIEKAEIIDKIEIASTADM